jgi:general stress protein 26
MNTMSSEQILDAARKIIKAAEYCFFITTDETGQPNARVMQPYEPEKDFTIYFGASPRSRKVKDVLRQPKVTLTFFLPQETAYLTLMGMASVVDDIALRQLYWRSNWNDLFPGGPESADYVLIKFVPRRMEMMNYAHQAMPQPYSLYPTALVLEGSKWRILEG